MGWVVLDGGVDWVEVHGREVCEGGDMPLASGMETGSQ